MYALKAHQVWKFEYELAEFCERFEKAHPDWAKVLRMVRLWDPAREKYGLVFLSLNDLVAVTTVLWCVMRNLGPDDPWAQQLRELAARFDLFPLPGEVPEEERESCAP